MPRYSRRAFLRSVSAAAGALALGSLAGGCQENPETPPTAEVQPTAPKVATAASQPTQAGQPTVASQPTGTGAPADTPAASQPGPDLVVARGGDPEEMVRRALKALGGMQRFVSKGNTVVVKPNVCVGYHTYEYAATTNPWVVGALVKLALEAGASKVQVMDYGFGGPQDQANQVTGIAEQVLAAGGEMVVMSSMQFRETEIPNAAELKSTRVFDGILNADVVINVPIAKTHSLARLTLGMKNLMGIIYSRDPVHYKLGEKLTDLYTLIRPSLTVIDAVRIMTQGGPTGGSLDYVKQMDTVIAGPDIVAGDAYAAKTLFDINPELISYIDAGARRGIGRMDYQNLKIEEIAL